MTNEELLEELLFEAHSQGVYHEVMEESKKIRYSNPDMTLLDAVYAVMNEVRV